MITLLIEMLGLPNFGYMYNIVWVTWWIFVGDIMDMNYDAIAFILNKIYFKKT